LLYQTDKGSYREGGNARQSLLLKSCALNPMMEEESEEDGDD